MCEIFNYADDNTLFCHGTSLDVIKSDLQNISSKMISWFEQNYMKANAEKFKFIIFDKKCEYTNDHIEIDNKMVQNDCNVKLLGLNIDCRLNFTYHVNELCSKAGRKLKVLARLSKTVDTESKLMLFHSFILSQFEYSSMLWHFCKSDDTKMVEKIQKQALRYVFNDYDSSYSELLQKCVRQLMYTNRLRNMIDFVHKCMTGNVPKYLENMFVPNTCSRLKRKGTQLKLDKFNTIKYGSQSLRHQACKLWNDFCEIGRAHV